MNRFIMLLSAAILLAACSSTQSIAFQPSATPPFVTATLPPTQAPWPTSNTVPVTPSPTTDPSIFSRLFPGSNAGNQLTRMDGQGMVTIEATPVNLGMPGDTLIFEVAMNTHSVDLSMDLATLSTLAMDSGLVVQASLWEAPRGGHHVSGKLIFPATRDGKSIFEGATKFTLTISNVDVPIRIFEWEL
jgi:hypothetical protein